MAGNMADLLLLLFSITISLLLFTAVDRILALPFFDPSRQEVRHLLAAIEDLLLPLGSFPSKFLHPWTSTFENCVSTPTASLPSPKTASGSIKYSEDEISPLIWLPSGDAVSKPIAINPSTGRIVVNSRSKPTTIPPPAGQLPSHGRSKPIIRSPPTVPTPNDSESNPTTLSPPSEPVDTRFIIFIIPTAPKPTPDGGHSFDSEDYPDDPFCDALETHPASDNDAQIAVSGVEVPLPEQQAAEIKPLDEISTVVGEREEGQQEENSTAVATPLPLQQATQIESSGRIPTAVGEKKKEQEEDSSTAVGKQEEEQQEENSTAVMAAALKKAQTFEKAIRELVNRQEMHGPDLQELVEVNAGTIERREEAEKDLRLMRQKNEELDEKNQTLQSEIAKAKEKRRLQKDEYNNYLRMLHAEKKSAEETATTATMGVEGRIRALKKEYEKAKEAAAFNNLQEQNELICSKRMVMDSLRDARRQLDAHDQQRKAETEAQKSTVKELKETVEQLRSSVTTTKELAASSERRLKNQFEDQVKDKDSEIAALKDHDRASKETVKELTKWKAVAETKQRSLQKMSDRLIEDTATLRSEKTHIASRLNIDIQGLKRTVSTNEATIKGLKGIIVGLKSGEEAQNLRKQLEQATSDRDRDLKDELRKSAEQKKKLSRKIEITQSAEQEARTQVQRLEDEKMGKTTEYQKAIMEKDEEICCLKKMVQEAKEAADARIKEFEKKVQESGVDKEQQHQEEKRNIAQSAEQRARIEVQRLEDEKKREMIEHQKAMTEKDEEVHRLRQTVQGEKEAVDATLREFEKKANDFVMDKERQHQQDKEKAVEEAAKRAVEDAGQMFQKQLEDERKVSLETQDKAAKIENDLRTEMGVLKKANDFVMDKERQHQQDKEKAVEEAAKRAVEDAGQMFQKQLEVERKVFRETQDKAAKIENDLRTEMGVLKSQVEKFAEAKSVAPADRQPGEDPREVTVLATETREANNLLLELEKTGITLGTRHHTVLQDLNTAKIALYKVRCELQESEYVIDNTGFLNIIYGADVNEEHIQRLDIVMQAVLIRQARVINARLQNLRKILRTSDGIQKDAMLEAINTPNPMNREIRKPRGLKRQTQAGPGMLPSNSSAGVQAEISKSPAQQTNGKPDQ